MVETSAATPSGAAASADGNILDAAPVIDKQQAQLAAFNEYMHKCRDLFKIDPTMVSISTQLYQSHCLNDIKLRRVFDDFVLTDFLDIYRHALK